MIARLEAVCPPESRIIAEELPDKKIAVILCAREASDALLEQFSRLVLSESKQQHLELQLVGLLGAEDGRCPHQL